MQTNHRGKLAIFVYSGRVLYSHDFGLPIGYRYGLFCMQLNKFSSWS